MSDEEWAFFAPFVIETGPRRGRRPRDHRLVLDGVFWIARTGSAWRDLHDHFGKWSSVYRQFRRWTLSGVWDVLLAALNESGEGPMTAAWFLAYVQRVLSPTLNTGDVVILDNLPAHKGAAVREAVEAVGARLLFLPAYSPDFNVSIR
jgi:transposase